MRRRCHGPLRHLASQPAPLGPACARGSIEAGRPAGELARRLNARRPMSYEEGPRLARGRGLREEYHGR